MHKKRTGYCTSYRINKGPPSYGIDKDPARFKPNPDVARSVSEPIKSEPLGRHTNCTSKAYQKATVSVPLTVKPFSAAGKPRTYCNSQPVLKDVRCGKRGCKYDFYDDYKDFDGYKDEYCDTTGDDICYFVFTQEICVEVPVHFGADVHAEPAWVVCHEASTVPCREPGPSNCEEGDEDDDGFLSFQP